MVYFLRVLGTKHLRDLEKENHDFTNSISVAAGGYIVNWFLVSMISWYLLLSLYSA